MQYASGVFKGTAANLVLGLGFIPDELLLINMEATVPVGIRWFRDLRSAEMIGGILDLQVTDSGTGDAVSMAGLTETTGVIPYFGQDGPLSADSTAYLIRQDADQRPAGAKGPFGLPWTLDTSANRTGHIGTGINTTHVGEGSRMVIQQKDGKTVEAVIMALTNDGDAADEIELDRAVGSGHVLRIDPMYTYSGAPAGTIVPKGVTIAQTTLNASGKRIFFRAIAA